MEWAPKGRTSWVQHTTPGTRLACLAGLEGSVLLADPAHAPGALLVGVSLAVWLGACAFPPRRVLALAGIGLTGFLSTFALLTVAQEPTGLGPRVLQAWSLAFKAAATTGFAWSTLATLRLREVLGAVSRWPGAVLLEQILHQGTVLAEDTKRMALAWSLRSAGGRLPWGILRAAPQVWLPRVAHRAVRVSEAMDLRGIPSHRLFVEPRPMGWADGLACTFTVAALLLAGWLRWRLP